MNGALKFILWLVALCVIGTILMTLAGFAGIGYVLHILESTK